MTEPRFDLFEPPGRRGVSLCVLRWRFTEQIALPGHSVGAGIVYSPAWAPGLSVSVDYLQIELTSFM